MFSSNFSKSLTVVLGVFLFPNVGVSGQFEINQDLAEMKTRPLCVGKSESVRYARMIRAYVDSHPGSTANDAMIETRDRLASHGGTEFNCYIFKYQPVYYTEPAEVIDLVQEYGIDITFEGEGLLLAKGDVIDENGAVITSASVGGDMYVFPSHPGEVKKNSTLAALTADTLGVLNRTDSGFGGDSRFNNRQFRDKVAPATGYGSPDGQDPNRGRAPDAVIFGIDSASVDESELPEIYKQTYLVEVDLS